MISLTTLPAPATSVAFCSIVFFSSVLSTGPLSVPLFLFYGLTKGAFLATEAAGSLGIYLSKSVTFQRFGALDGQGLRHVDDLSYAELSEVLGRPEGTLKAQVSRGLAMLRAAAAGTEL